MTDDRLNGLFETAFDIYHEFNDYSFVVNPSFPILFFGDLERFKKKSRTKIVTVGLNPSEDEFPHADPFKRFPIMRGWKENKFDNEEYLRALSDYFHAKTAYDWFKVGFEPLLNGLGASYWFHPETSTALHSDLCAPLATNPTWSDRKWAKRPKIDRQRKEELAKRGAGLWRALVEWLNPDLIIASLRRQYVLREVVPATPLQTIYEVTRRKDGTKRAEPFSIQACNFRHENLRVPVVFGINANVPFGTLSKQQKEVAGLFLRRHFHLD